jgi:hypothetical protein
MHRWSAKVSTTQVRELTTLPADEIYPALNGPDDGREDTVFGGRTAKVVANEVVRIIVDVEAVRDVVAVESKGFARDRDGYSERINIEGLKKSVCLLGLLYSRLAAPTDATNPAVNARAAANRLGDGDPSIMKSSRAQGKGQLC